MEYLDIYNKFNNFEYDLGQVTIAIETAHFFNPVEEVGTYEFICAVVEDIYYKYDYSVIEILRAIDKAIQDNGKKTIIYNLEYGAYDEVLANLENAYC